MSEIRLPELGENIETVEVSAVLVAVGDMVLRDQPLIEVETEKASLEVPSTDEGRVADLRVKQGDKVKVGQVLLVVESRPSASASASAGAAAPSADPAPEPKPEPAPVVAFTAKVARGKPEIGPTVPAGPSVRALARELGLDIRQVPGSGPAGRISRDDVKAYAKRVIQATSGASRAAAAATPPLPDFSRWGEVAREPLSRIRRVTAARMASAWASVPHVTQFDRADITETESMRKRFNRRSEDARAKLTVTALAVKLVAATLRQFPKFNASLDLDGDAVVYKRYVHIGVAVDTERGLLVPVVRDVDRKGLLATAAEIADLARRAREKKIAPDELQGASFTVSNLGGLGTTHFSPIVNWPEVAILGLGRAEVQAIHESGGFQPRLILPLSLSYDHRLIDGADAARFLRSIAEALEQPLLLLLDEP